MNNFKEIKKQYEARHSQLDNLLERYKKEIDKLDEDYSNEMKKLHNRFIEDMISNIYDIQTQIEKFDFFSFDGYRVSRSESALSLFISDKEMVEYQLKLENGVFVYNNESINEEVKAEIEDVIQVLNVYVSHYYEYSM